MPRMRILIESDIEGESKVFHTTVEISTHPAMRFIKPFRPSSEHFIEMIGGVGNVIVRNVISLPGVTEVEIKPYSLKVLKGKAFEWDDIERQVQDILLRHAYQNEAPYTDVSRIPSQCLVSNPEPSGTADLLVTWSNGQTYRARLIPEEEYKTKTGDHKQA